MQPQRETFEIEDIRVLEVLNNPMRLRILHHLKTPSTVRDLAERLGAPVTRLYYHVNLLEEVGVIRVVETRKAGAMLQKVYRTVAGDFRPAAKLAALTDDKDRMVNAAIGIVLDGARLDATAALLGHFESSRRPPEEPWPGTLGRSVVAMTEEGARRMEQRIRELVDEMAALEDGDGEEFAFSFVFFPMVGPVRGETI